MEHIRASLAKPSWPMTLVGKIVIVLASLDVIRESGFKNAEGGNEHDQA
jgi:hypothetical protein